MEGIVRSGWKGLCRINQRCLPEGTIRRGLSSGLMEWRSFLKRWDVLRRVRLFWESMYSGRKRMSGGRM
ncbi:hypothetical protein A2U01_0099811 [Trifolium medium]|uniref:Uncharacterized protein n=1 Tax=Trifolium medium TaxID=97028 RepID=A0A392UUG5_9FABA|nr:hypothetical protein [Trifolium medium]